MTSLDFVTYCVGVGIVMISSGVLIRLITPATRVTKQPQQEKPREPEMVQHDDIASRLQAFQSMRYASPIIRRQIESDQQPQFRIPARLREENQLKKKQDSVVTLPAKPKKDDTNKE